MNNPLAGTDPSGYIVITGSKINRSLQPADVRGGTIGVGGNTVNFSGSLTAGVAGGKTLIMGNNGAVIGEKSPKQNTDKTGIGGPASIAKTEGGTSVDASNPKETLTMIQGVLGKLEKYNKLMNSEEAQAQLLLTAAVESDFIPRDQNVEGGGKGMFQIEAKADGSKTLGDLYANFLNSRTELKNIVDGIGGLTDKSTHADRIQALRTNQEYGAALARLVYWRSDTVKSLSGPSNVKGMACDWFNGYNKPNPSQRRLRDPSFPNKAIRRWNEYKLGELF